MPFSFGSSAESHTTKNKTGDNVSIASNGSKTKQPKDARTTDASIKSGSGTRDTSDDVNAQNPTKLFAFVSKRNWSGAVKRCTSNSTEASKWIVEYNKDGTIRWRLLPIHQVGL